MRIKAAGPLRRIRWSFFLLFLTLAFPVLLRAQTNAPAASARRAGISEPLLDPVALFKRYLTPYEPIYFVVGAESPNAKFQFGFKYQLLIGEATNWWSGFHAAYTQTSVWDLSAPSAPFLDTSYKPELFYLWRNALGGAAGDRFRLDAQGGVQHESNGKAGADSRSLNLVYLRPTLTLGDADGIQFTVQPRLWCYLGDLSNNQNLEDYRGYLDLRVMVAWNDIQLSALGRMGHTGNHHSVQVDLTYRVPKTTVYLDVQYFTGYGETLLRYNQCSDAIRAGIALYR